MEGEWVVTTIGEVTDLLTGFPFKSDRYVDDASAPRLLRGDNIAQGVLRWNGVKRWPKNEIQELGVYALREGDIVLAMDRPWIEAGLKYAAIRESDLPSFLVQRVARLRGKNGLENRFLKYVIGSSSFTNHVLSVQTGTAVPHISGNQIKAFQFLLPPIEEQRAIAYILGTLDDKIELNRKMNHTLEDIAHALFKSWFVDNTEKILFGNLVRPKKGKNITKSNAIEGEFPVVAGGIEPSCYHNEPNTKAPVVTISASGANAGFIKLYHTPVWSSDSSFIDESITPYVYFSYVFLKINQKQLFEKQEGSAQPHIYPSHIMELKMAATPQHLIKKYESTVSPYFKKSN